MNPSRQNIADRREAGWTYASLAVIDGARLLKPAAVAFDRIDFAQAPHLTSAEIQIVLTNGDAEQRHVAAVLPHDHGATRIPIRLLRMV